MVHESAALAPNRLSALTGWGRAHQSTGRLVRAPSDDDLRSVMNATGGPLITRGCGSSYGDAATRDGGTVMDMTSRCALLHFDPVAGIAVAEAGLTLGALLVKTQSYGWRPPVLPGTPHVTLGGAVAADIHGKNHARAGSIGVHVDWMILVSGDLRPRYLAPDAHPEEFWATVGGLGLTGAIAIVALRLTPLGEGLAVTTRQRGSSLRHVMDLVDEACTHESDEVHAVAWLDPSTASGRGLVDTTVLPRNAHPHHFAETHDAGVSTSGRPAGQGRQARSLPGPGLVSRPTIRSASLARWVLPSRQGRRHGVSDALMPMQHAEVWPRVFGRAGLIQYQFAVPTAAADAVTDILGVLRKRRLDPALAVLKRLGSSDPAPLGFALDGWTLALDLPARWPGVRSALLDIDHQVIDAGGRVYLAKDVRLEASSVPAMYPRLSSWRRMRDAMDPDNRFGSDLSRRLHLTP